MSVIVPNTADLQMLKFVVNFQATDGGSPPSGGNRLLRLYTNNLTPGKSTAYADVVECISDGYSAITLIGTSWTIATNTGINSAVYAAQTFTMTETDSVYGYYVTTQDDDLLWIERFTDGPYLLPSDGGEIVVVPKIIFN